MIFQCMNKGYTKMSNWYMQMPKNGYIIVSIYPIKCKMGTFDMASISENSKSNPQ